MSHDDTTKQPVYTPQDQDKVRSVSKWLEDRKQSRAWLARKARISSSTVSQVLGGKYPSSPSAILDTMLQVLQVETDRLGDGTPGYIEGSVHKLAVVLCDRTRKHANFGVLVGYVGVGKTRSLKEYAARRPQTLLVEANPLMQPGSLLVELLEQLDVTVPASLDAKFHAVVTALRGTSYLVIIDEAENLSGQALHYLRRIRDKAQVGVVLAGTEKLTTLLKPEHGQFDQIRSRVSMWPATVKGITRDDMDDMARDALREDFGELADDALEALWAYCAGSARVLMEGLIPALRDYGQGKGAISGKLVETIAEKVLFMRRKGQAS